MNMMTKKCYHWLELFNKYDLYTKSDNIVIDESVKQYYIKHVHNYIGTELYI